MLKLPLHTSTKSGPTVGDASFLPEDYVQRRNEMRTNVISVTLFILVTLGVVGAFLVTNRQWNEVKDYQQAINIRYTQAAQDIEQLKKLEKQKEESKHKAELIRSLIEPVPRSILLAEVINRMPDQMGLLEINLTSERIDKARVTRQITGSSSFSDTNTDSASDPPRIAPPLIQTSVKLVGVTPTHQDVAQFVAALRECPLLVDVELIASETSVFKKTNVLRYEIEARIHPGIDARHIDPTERPRLNPKDSAPDPEELLESLTNAGTEDLQ